MRSVQKQDRAFQRQSKTGYGTVKRGYLAGNSENDVQGSIDSFWQVDSPLVEKGKRTSQDVKINVKFCILLKCTIQRWRLEIECYLTWVSTWGKTSTLVCIVCISNLITFIFRLSTLLATLYFSVRRTILDKIIFPNSICVSVPNK